MRLVRVLGERDGSIEVLRKLAVEKEGRVRDMREGGSSQAEKDGEGASSAEVKQDGGNAKPAVDYASLTLERLRVMEKARDATLGFLLKRIDKAEAELKDLETSQENG